MHIKRHLAEIIKTSKASLLLLGPRQTGKSTLIRSFSPDIEVDLADEEVYLDYLRDPGLLRRRVAGARTIFIDEVQRIPSLLNTVQSLLDHADRNSRPRFLLTGSSARKLRRGKANLLPGRIQTYELGPLSLTELGRNADVPKLLSLGALPGIYLEPDLPSARKFLRTYAATYLREEVQAEALTRNLEGFSRFFDLLSARSGDSVDFNKFASLARIERMSAKRYFDILVDTLITVPVESFSKSAGRRLIQHPKYYFFDVGVLNGCLANFEPSADRKGSLFEHLVLQLLRSELQSRDLNFRISTFRTEAGTEVDFILECGKETIAIEAKATRNIGTHDLRGLHSFAKYYGKRHQSHVLTLGDAPEAEGSIRISPLVQGLREIVSTVEG